MTNSKPLRVARSQLVFCDRVTAGGTWYVLAATTSELILGEHSLLYQFESHVEGASVPLGAVACLNMEQSNWFGGFQVHMIMVDGAKYGPFRTRIPAAYRRRLGQLLQVNEQFKSARWLVCGLTYQDASVTVPAFLAMLLCVVFRTGWWLFLIVPGTQYGTWMVLHLALALSAWLRQRRRLQLAT